MPSCIPSNLWLTRTGRRVSTRRQARRNATGLALLLLVGCSGDDLAVRGRVTAGGKPVDSGTINFEGQSGGRSFGGAVQQGAFDLGRQQGFNAGSYRAILEGFRVTGRTINDYQRGSIPEIVPLVLANDSIEVTITAENAQGLEINFPTKQSK